MSLIDQLRARNQQYEAKYIREHIPFMDYMISLEELNQWETFMSERLLELAADGKNQCEVDLDVDYTSDNWFAVPLMTWMEKSRASIDGAIASRGHVLISMMNTKIASLLTQMRDFWNSRHPEVRMELFFRVSPQVDSYRISWEKNPKRIKLN